jgi:hypothetical protein
MQYFKDLNDKRLLTRGNSILNRLFSSSVYSIRQLTQSDSEAKVMYRFYRRCLVQQECLLL